MENGPESGCRIEGALVTDDAGGSREVAQERR